MASYFSLAEVLRWLGLGNLPGVPLSESVPDLVETVLRLGLRTEQDAQAKAGFSTPFTIGDRTATASTFMFGNPASHAGPHRSTWHREAAEWLRGVGTTDILELFRALRSQEPSALASRTLPPRAAPPGTSLTAPEQFALSWTTWNGVLRDARPLLPALARTLTDAESATDAFWPNFAEHGTGYNLLVLQRVLPADGAALQDLFGPAWGNSGAPAALESGRLYAIDMRVWEGQGAEASRSASGRVTPSAVVLLRQNDAKQMRPFCIRISIDGNSQVYARGECTDGAWLFALQAAKAAITVWGIWIGHVYHWHSVTAAMVMAMARTLPDGHPVAQILQPHANYLIEFDEVLMLLWERIAPPTSVAGAWSFLVLQDAFAAGRLFSDDDPLATLGRQHLDKAAFSRDADWDLFPVAGHLLRVWTLAESYVRACVEASYPDDAAVAGDSALRAWRDAAADPDVGNVRGLPALVTRAELIGVVTSLIYRVTMHGVSRLGNSINPQMSFVANYPPCLENPVLPSPTDPIDTAGLLRYLPNTATIGEVIDFYFIFLFSPPYEPLLPETGPTTDLLFPGGAEAPRNRALVTFREGLMRFMDDYQGGDPQYQQWPRNIET